MNRFYDTLRRSPIRRGPSRVFGGLCGGIAEKFGWNPAVVRIITLILFLLPVIGLGLYLVLWLLIPLQNGSIILERITSSNGRD
ncbi:PspC domain-containing protein [Mycetocola spongiae]|uniref:PspC domain-containing protein n=1 Tax=Mycetocola spongiae TaxID=2859226 RepID=UPI001CF1DCC8|nr:PspC domain-containing protein [Mycetocola spongiae]UCR90111.1 PspC domain-containing protein [Mycetocola spongiae]